VKRWTSGQILGVVGLILFLIGVATKAQSAPSKRRPFPSVPRAALGPREPDSALNAASHSSQETRVPNAAHNFKAELSFAPTAVRSWIDPLGPIPAKVTFHATDMTLTSSRKLLLSLLSIAIIWIIFYRLKPEEKQA